MLHPTLSYPCLGGPPGTYLTSPFKYEILCLQVRASHYPGYYLQVSYFHAQQWLAFLHISNALLVTAVHVKMKAGDNTLNNERLSLVNTKILANCSPYFTALQYINNLETKSYTKGRLISTILNF